MATPGRRCAPAMGGLKWYQSRKEGRMLQVAPTLQVSLAQTPADIRAAQRLRYDVFVEELGGIGPHVDHTARLETDPFDAFADHLLLRDARQRESATDGVIGVYRIMTRDQAKKAGQFYSEDEFDLSPLLQSPRALLEIGRSCLHPQARGGAGLMALWQGLSDYARDHAIDTVFGVASFHGTDPAPVQNALSHLHHMHLAPPEIRPVSKTPDAFTPIQSEDVDRKNAMRSTPALIKSYLKLGGAIGQGVFIDHAFNTIDVCMVLNTRDVPDNAFARPKRSPE